MNQVVGYADNVYLLGKSASSVNVYEELKLTVVKIGLNINIKKPKLYYRHVHIVGGLSS
jgi:hypothetical protein